jgi:hypothetical protein
MINIVVEGCVRRRFTFRNISPYMGTFESIVAATTGLVVQSWQTRSILIGWIFVCALFSAAAENPY